MDDRMRKIGHACESVMGACLPGSKRDARHAMGWLAGLGSLAVLFGVCYAAVWTYDRRIGQFVDHKMTERRRKDGRLSSEEMGRLPSDRAAVREATGAASSNGTSEVVDMHDAATSTAGGSL